MTADKHPRPWHLGDKTAIYDADSGYVTRLSSRELAEEIIDAVNAGGLEPANNEDKAHR